MKRQWMHKYRKEHPEERDLVEKFLLIKILREKFGRYGLTGEVVNIGEEYRYPDVMVNSIEPQEVYELDGEYHGFGEIQGRKDLSKDDFYSRAGVTVYHINKVQTDGYSEDRIIECLCALGLKSL